MGNAKIEKLKWDILGDFQTLWISGYVFWPLTIEGGRPSIFGQKFQGKANQKLLALIIENVADALFTDTYPKGWKSIDKTSWKCLPS